MQIPKEARLYVAKGYVPYGRGKAFREFREEAWAIADRFRVAPYGDLPFSVWICFYVWWNDRRPKSLLDLTRWAWHVFNGRLWDESSVCVGFHARMYPMPRSCREAVEFIIRREDTI